MNRLRLKVLSKVALLTFIPVFSLAVLAHSGCTTGAQRIAANTIQASDATATAAYAGYCDAVIKGLASTNSFPTVSKKFNQFKADELVAIDLSQNNSNALTPTNLSAELTDLLSAITLYFPQTTIKQITPTP